MFKRIYRSLLDRELGVLGGELEAAETRIEDQARKLLSLQDRFERLINRVSMRLARSGRGDEHRDREILKSLAQRSQRDPGGNGNDFDDGDWPR
mgnify:CR=1 FL=1